MKIIANVTLVKAGGEIAPGDSTTLNDAEAKSLIERGFARSARGSEPEPTTPVLDAAADAILSHNVDQITEVLPDLADDKLVALLTAEKDGKARATLISAMQAEIESRQGARMSGED